MKTKVIISEKEYNIACQRIFSIINSMLTSGTQAKLHEIKKGEGITPPPFPNKFQTYGTSAENGKGIFNKYTKSMTKMQIGNI